MDKPFGQDPGRAQSPVSRPTAVGSSAYQLNLSRTKSRKWVEARVQSYDGDDWGAEDEYDDEDESEPESVPQPPIKQTRPSNDAAVMPSATAGLSSLRSQEAAATVPSNGPSSIAIKPPPFVPDPPSVGSSHDHARGTSPQSAGAAPSAAPMSKEEAGKPMPFKHPSDIYRRMEEEQGRGRGPMEDQAESNREGGACSEHDEGLFGRHNVSPKLPDVTRMSGFGSDLFASTRSGSSIASTIPETGTGDVSWPLPRPSHKNVDLDTAEALASMPDTTPPPPVARETATRTPKPEQCRTDTPSQQPPSTAQPPPVVEDRPSVDMGHRGIIQTLAEDAREHLATDLDANNQRDRVHFQGVSLASEADEDHPRVTATSTIHHPQPQQPGWRLECTSPIVPPLRTPSPRQLLDRAPGGTHPQQAPSTARDKSPAEAGEASRQGQSDRYFEPLPRRHASPVTDSDVLSDEILRSLSPGGSTSYAEPSLAERGNNLRSGSRNAARDCGSTLRDYDDCYVDSSDKPESTLRRGSANAPAEPSKSDGKAHSPDIPGVCRRFSWEAGDNEATPASAEMRSQSSAGREPMTAAAQDSQPEQTPTLPSTGAADMPPGAARSATPKPQDPGPGAVGMSQREQDQPAVPQPPSPMSAVSDGQSGAAPGGRGMSLADEKAFIQTASGFASPTPPPESHPALACQASPKTRADPGEQTQAQSVTLRDIMGMPVSADRITKYNETREYFASMDSGLDTWLECLKLQHPEYANGPTLFTAGAPRQSAQPAGNPSSAGALPPAQQPYYQQYLNASPPNTGGPTPSRPRPDGPQMPSQATGSAFGHSGNQIGTKSKEFMQSAGKMGRGLLNKGKNKLRGSGDKGESSTFPIQPKVEQEHRTSSGVNAGATSRPDESAPQSELDLAPPVREYTSAPSMKRFVVNERASKRVPPTPVDTESADHHQPPVPLRHPPDPAGRASAGSSKPETPFGSPVVKNDGVDFESGAIQPMRADGRPCPPNLNQTTAVSEDCALEGWVLVPRQSGDQHDQAVPPEHRTSFTQLAPPVPQAEVGGMDLQPQPQANGHVPKRTTSFVGLPPIRKCSTFDLTIGTERTSQHLSCAADGDHDHEARTIEDGDKNAVSDLSDDAIDELGAPESSRVLQGVSFVETPPADYGQLGVSISAAEAGRGAEASETPAPTKVRVSQEAPEETKHQDTPAQPNPAFVRPPMLVNPVPGLATAPWILEESHLSEPLHRVARNRHGNGSLQPPIFYDYDKETGLFTPMLHPPSTNHRPRPSDVPPSSAQRFPSLFSTPLDHNAQLHRAISRTSGQPHPHQCREPVTRREAMIPRTEGSEFEIAGVGPPLEEELGRNFRNSGIFKDIGSRIAQATSRERRPSLAEPGPATSSIHDDEVSEFSVVTRKSSQERKKRWSSLFFGLPGHTSTDQSSRLQETFSGHDLSVADVQEPSVLLQPGPDPRPLLFVRRSSPTGPPISPASSPAKGSSREVMSSNDEGAPPKKRTFSNMVKIAGIFHRSGQDHAQKLEAPPTGDTGAASQYREKTGSMSPPLVFHHGMGIGNTKSSSAAPWPRSIVYDDPERRGRGGSVKYPSRLLRPQVCLQDSGTRAPGAYPATDRAAEWASAAVHETPNSGQYSACQFPPIWNPGAVFSWHEKWCQQRQDHFNGLYRSSDACDH